MMPIKKEGEQGRRRRVELDWFLFLFCLAVLIFPGPSDAQEDVEKFPSRPFAFIIPIPAGGPTDLSFRLMFLRLGQALLK